MVINELMSSRKWKGAKVCDGIAAASKIPSQEKFFNQQNLAAGGVKAEPEKFVHQRKNWVDERKRKGGHQGEARICRQQNLAKRRKILKVSR
jgi:hypothetical protein